MEIRTKIIHISILLPCMIKHVTKNSNIMKSPERMFYFHCYLKKSLLFLKSKNLNNTYFKCHQIQHNMDEVL